MSSSNGIIRIGKKGLRKFAIGEEDDPRHLPVFEIDVVVAFQQWITVDNSFRPQDPTVEDRSIAVTDVPAYQQAAVALVESFGGPQYAGKVTTAEALDFLARLREQYDELATFFRPRLREERASPATSEEGSGLRFSVET